VNLYVDGVLTPPADAGSLDGVPAALQPVGPAVDGYVVTYDYATGDLELQPGGGGGMTNPMTTIGDMISALPGGVPDRLAAGSAGYILRVVAGQPTWRELFVAGTSRPPATATREGQWYWTTNAAAGLELAVCTHQGGPTYAWVTVPYSVTATGAALVQAADVAAAQAALGFDPSTLAAQALLVAATRRGPVTMTGWTDSDYVAPIATPASGAQPLVTLGSSGVAVVYSSQAGGYAPTHFFASHDPFAPTPPRGFAMSAGGSDIALVSITAGFPFVSFVGVIAAVGWASVAWSIDGAGAVRYSIGTGTGIGSAAGPAAGTLAALLPRTTDPVRIGAGVYTGIASSLPVSYLALWPSILSDADLEQLASSPASGAPVLPSSPAWEWAAAGHVGCGRVSIGADVYRVVGAPALWMP
jgi:hypothetical protein